MEVVNATPANSLHEIFKLQRSLVNQYMIIEGLPQYPVELNSKKSQALIKDFMARFQEELHEGYDELERLHNGIANNTMLPQEAMKHVLNYNEEMADSTHFMVELLLYVDINEDNIEQYIDKLMENTGKMATDLGRPLKTLYLMAAHNNQDIMDVYRRATNFTVVSQNTTIENPLCAGGHSISHELLEWHGKFLFEIDRQLFRAKKLMKNKAHRQSDPEMEAIFFRQAILEVFTSYIQYLSFSGINETSLYQSYIRKNAINLERIKNKY